MKCVWDLVIFTVFTAHKRQHIGHQLNSYAPVVIFKIGNM